MTEVAVPAADAVTDWIPTADDFGSRLALIRRRMGWNIKEAARECGVPGATWRLWEVEGALPRNIVTVAKTIATRTGVDYLWLVHGPDRGGVPSTRPYSEPRVLPRRRKGRSHDVSAHHLPATRPVRQTRPFGEPSRRLPVDV